MHCCVRNLLVAWRIAATYLCGIAILSGASYAQKTINVPADAPTIQGAINMASNGDTVLVAAGTYAENIQFKGKAITVTGAAGAAATILDGQARGAVVTFNSGEGRSSVLSNFTVQNGVPAEVPDAGGIFVDGASPTIENNIIQDNYACGIGVVNGAPLIQGNSVLGTVFGSRPDQIGCVLGNANQTYGNYVRGTGVAMYGEPPSGQQAEIIGNTIENNVGDLSPAAISIVNGGAPLIENNVIANNQSNLWSGLYAVGDSAPVIVQNLIYGNAANAMNVENPAYFTGAGIAVAPSSGAYASAQAVVVNNTIVFNTVVYVPNTYQQGTQVLLSGDYNRIIFANNIVAGTGSFPALACAKTGDETIPSPQFNNNDVFVVGGAAPYGDSCSDQTGVNGNISTDPPFASADANTPFPYQLQLQSPAIDSGDNSAPDLPAEDILGQPRIQNAKGLPKAIVDMGVYEYPGVAAPPPPADFALAIDPASLRIVNGQQGTVTVTLTPTSSFQGTVTLSCGTPQPELSCAFQPQQVSLGNGFPQIAQLTIQTGNTASARRAGNTTGHRSSVQLAGFLLPGSMVGILLSLQRRRLGMGGGRVLMILALSYFATGISACGVTFNGYPGTYTVVVSGTANGEKIAHQANLAVTVEQ